MKKLELLSQVKVKVSIVFMSIMLPMMSQAELVSHLCVNQQSERKIIEFVTSQQNWKILVDKKNSGEEVYYACAPVSEFNKSNITTQQLVQVLNILQSTDSCSQINSNVLLLKQYLKSATNPKNFNRYSSVESKQNLMNQLQAFELAQKMSQCDQGESI